MTENVTRSWRGDKKGGLLKWRSEAEVMCVSLECRQGQAVLVEETRQDEVEEEA